MSLLRVGWKISKMRIRTWPRGFLTPSSSTARAKFTRPIVTLWRPSPAGTNRLRNGTAGGDSPQCLAAPGRAAMPCSTSFGLQMDLTRWASISFSCRGVICSGPDGDPQKLGKDDVVVLLDDFSGTGTQVCTAWNDPETSFGALLAGVGKVYLILVAASKTARRRISAETALCPVLAHELHESDNVFSDECKHFTTADRAKLLHYGKIADKRNPMGFGDC